MNFSAIHEEKWEMNRVDKHSTESTERPDQPIIKLRKIGKRVVMSLKFLKVNCSRSFEANVSKILTLNKEIFFCTFAL